MANIVALKRILPVILCGGSGSRLWPLSRKNHPKQLLNFLGEHSLLQQTMLRLQGLKNLFSPMVICNESHRFMVAEQLQVMGIESPRIILEPCAKNTAPAIAIAAFLANQNDLLLVLPADHQIKHPEKFYAAVEQAVPLAEAAHLITFGIQANHAETGYGYIKRGASLGSAYRVDQFVEKPDFQLAKQYVESGQYDWNSGMFLFRASTYLDELQQFSPDVYQTCQQAALSLQVDFNFTRVEKTAFESCPAISIDYAVMEKSQNVAIVPLQDSGWSDLGSWDAIYEANNKDHEGNVRKGDVHTENVTNSYLHAESRLLAVVGVSDHIVMETADAVLVAHKDAAQDVKAMVSRLESIKRSETDLHRRVYRPWGCYEVIDTAAHFQVKRISVKPNASLSLQMHQFRSEHWIVIQGEAAITRDEQMFNLKENESTYIPAGTKHRLHNPGEKMLVLIEVQTGSYLGEDDIVRYEDNYGREAGVSHV